MKHVYNLSEAYFSVQPLSTFTKDVNSTLPHLWFTMLIVDSFTGELLIDDVLAQSPSPKIIFLTPGQHIGIRDNTVLDGFAISFNKEFYCIEYHDSEVSCNGLLFANNYSLVQIELDQQQHSIYTNTVKEIENEFAQNDPLLPEMLKNLLKNLLIRSSRLFRTQHALSETTANGFDLERKFSALVEKHFKETKQVEAYADMMRIAPASLTKKLHKYGLGSPSQIIKNRIVLEAKRLLIYTDKSVKEIATMIGYDDPFYFSRFFSKESGISPKEFRKLRQIG